MKYYFFLSSMITLFTITLVSCGTTSPETVEDNYQTPSRRSLQNQTYNQTENESSPEELNIRLDDRPWSLVKFFGQSFASHYNLEKIVATNTQVLPLSFDDNIRLNELHGMHLVSFANESQNLWVRQSGLGSNDNEPTTCKNTSSTYCSSSVTSSGFDDFSKQALSQSHILLARNNMPNARVLIQKSNYQPASQNTELFRACSGSTTEETLPSNVSGIRDLMNSLSKEMNVELLNNQQTQIYSCSLIEFNTGIQDNINFINNETTQNLIPWGIYGFYFEIHGQKYEIVIYAPVGARFGTGNTSSLATNQTQGNLPNLLPALPGQQGPTTIIR